MKNYILSIDQGTTSSRAVIFDSKSDPVSFAQKELPQYFPRPGWVEHDPEEIWSTQAGVIIEAMAKAGIKSEEIAAIGIANQRETTIVWNRKTGKPLGRAIVWQDRRTASLCDQLRDAGYDELIRSKTGLVIDAYFSATKIKWILDNFPDAYQMASDGQLAFGTVDSWLVWKLSGGKIHATDISNASRTMLFNIHTLEWDSELLNLFDIPYAILPEVRSSREVYIEAEEHFVSGIAVSGVAGDQQAALFGQMCLEPGMVKSTYGTGGFMVMNTGTKPVESKNGLLTTIAWMSGSEVVYALEGSIFIAGAVVQWMRDCLGIIRSSGEIEYIASKVKSTEGVYFVPAFAGLGAPYWNQNAKAVISGLTRGSTAAHIARAGLESIAFQTCEILTAMESDSGIKIKELRVDGGATRNNFLMQFQADIMQSNVIIPSVTEATALGAAYLAGLSVGLWSSVNEIKDHWKINKVFTPVMAPAESKKMIDGWLLAVKMVNGHYRG